MIALLIGILFIGGAVFAVLPGLPLNWGSYVVDFLKGSGPVLAALIGLIALFVGIADIKDRAEAKKEEAQESKDKESDKGQNA